jgi:hypothetical protein
MGEAERIDALRQDTFDALEKQEKRIMEPVDKVYRRVFENNGEISIVQEIKDQDDSIQKTDIKAGRALETATRVGKYCGAPLEYDSKREGETCPMNEIAEVIRFFKKRGKMLLIFVVIFGLAVIGLMAWSGITTREQMFKLATDVGKINKALNP